MGQRERARSAQAGRRTGEHRAARYKAAALRSAAAGLAMAITGAPALADEAQHAASWSAATVPQTSIAQSDGATSQPTIRFDISSQPLPTALLVFGRQAGLQVTVDSAATAGKQAPPVVGSFTAEEALSRLLAGSGLSWRFVGDSTVTLERAGAGEESGPARLGTIKVGAIREGEITDSYADPRNFAATRTDTPVIDTPQSTQAITRQALEDAGATSVADAFQYLAGITPGNVNGGLEGNEYLARGFNADNILINGNRGGRPVALDTANVERVEAIRGPTATLFGRADPGGLVNVVTKQPLAEPFYEADLQGGSGFFGDGSRYRDVRGAIDAGGPIDEQGRVRYRFNAAAEYERSFRQDIDNTLFFVSPVVDVELDDKTVANLELTYQYRDFVFDQGVPFIDGEPQLPLDFWWGEGQTPSVDAHYLSGALRVDRELSDALTARLGVYSNYEYVDGRSIQGSLRSGSQARARQSDFDQSNLIVTVQPELVAELTTGPIGHTLLFGVDASYRSFEVNNDIGRFGTSFNIFEPNFPVDIRDIDLSQPGTFSAANEGTATELGLYVQDQVDLSEQWKLLAGLRWDAVWLDGDSEILPFFPRQDGDFDDSALLPRLGIVYQPIEEIGFYASYSETYRPPVAVTQILSDGTQPDPEEGRNYEVGVKLDALDGRLVGTLAVFRADKENVLEADPFIPFQTINLGEVRSQGVEVDLSGEVFENFSLGASYAFTDAQVNSNENPNLPKGTKFRNVPRHAAALQAAYRFTEGALKGLRLFGGVVYEGKKPARTSPTNRVEIPDYLRFDIGASYDVTDNIQARLFIQNLTDKEYYTSAQSSGNVIPGQPFNATLGVRVRF